MADFYQITITRFVDDTGFTDTDDPTRQLARLRSGGAANAAELEALETQLLEPKKEFERVILHASPTMSESRTAEYVDQGLPGPVGIVVYTLTQNRRFNISAKFISTTVDMAKQNYKYVNLLRSWLIPRGHKQSESGGTGGQPDNSAKTGRPPVLRLNGHLQQFFNIPVVLSELTINYPDDVDYIETDNAMVPIVQDVTMNFIEAHGREGESLGEDAKKAEADRLGATFDMKLFKEGNLSGY